MWSTFESRSRCGWVSLSRPFCLFAGLSAVAGGEGNRSGFGSVSFRRRLRGDPARLGRVGGSVVALWLNGKMDMLFYDMLEYIL